MSETPEETMRRGLRSVYREHLQEIEDPTAAAILTLAGVIAGQHGEIKDCFGSVEYAVGEVEKAVTGIYR